jgi:hypothetical protein
MSRRYRDISFSPIQSPPLSPKTSRKIKKRSAKKVKSSKKRLFCSPLKKKIERKSQSKYRSLNPGVQYDEYKWEEELKKLIDRIDAEIEDEGRWYNYMVNLDKSLNRENFDSDLMKADEALLIRLIDEHKKTIKSIEAYKRIIQKAVQEAPNKREVIEDFKNNLVSVLDRKQSMNKNLIQQKSLLNKLKKVLTQHSTTDNVYKKNELIMKVEEEVERLQSLIDKEEQSKQLELERLNEAAAHSI